MAASLNGTEQGMMENGEIDFEDWQPPTEAELKVIEAKRERQDKISKLMGEYLLKGYKMLGSTCTVCGTILLRTKQGVDYCVACNELDSDSTKDDPALNDFAAQRQAQESHLKQTTSFAEAGEPCVPTKEAKVSLSAANTNGTWVADVTTNSFDLINGPGTNDASVIIQKPTASECIPPNSRDERLEFAVRAVMEKLEWASNLLHQTQDVDMSVRLCNLVKSCADAVRSLRSAEAVNT